MGQVLIRNLDDMVLAAYRRAAKSNGRSLEAELRETLGRARPAAGPSADELRELSRRLRALTPAGAAAIDSTGLIRAARDDRA